MICASGSSRATSPQTVRPPRPESKTRIFGARDMDKPMKRKACASRANGMAEDQGRFWLTAVERELPPLGCGEIFLLSKHTKTVGAWLWSMRYSTGEGGLHDAANE